MGGGVWRELGVLRVFIGIYSYSDSLRAARRSSSPHLGSMIMISQPVVFTN